MTLVVGVDAGGTSSRAVAVTLGAVVVGRGTAGPGNPFSAGDAGPVAVGRAVRTALAGHDPASVVRVVVGLAGDTALADPRVAAGFDREWTAAGLGCPVEVCGDAVAAFAAGSSSPSGAVLVAGTGAVAARLRTWRVVRTADGLGWLLGDEGSGRWLGLQALRAVARAWGPGRGCGSPLEEEVVRHTGAVTREQLVRWAAPVPLDAVAGLAPGVCRAATAGDPVAARLVRDAADRLVGTLDELGDPGGPVVLSGGLLARDTPVRDAVRVVLRHRGTSVGTARDPAAGAAWLALRVAADLDRREAEAAHAALLGASA